MKSLIALFGFCLLASSVSMASESWTCSGTWQGKDVSRGQDISGNETKVLEIERSFWSGEFKRLLIDGREVIGLRDKENGDKVYESRSVFGATDTKIWVFSASIFDANATSGTFKLDEATNFAYLSATLNCVR
jgi:hypothetical protein